VLPGAGHSDRRGVNRAECGELSDRRAVEGSVIRVVGASLGPAAGIGAAVGIELRTALHQSAGAAAGVSDRRVTDGSVLGWRCVDPVR